jgi:hypothetical protein
MCSRSLGEITRAARSGAGGVGLRERRTAQFRQLVRSTPLPPRGGAGRRALRSSTARARQIRRPRFGGRPGASRLGASTRPVSRPRLAPSRYHGAHREQLGDARSGRTGICGLRRPGRIGRVDPARHELAVGDALPEEAGGKRGGIIVACARAACPLAWTLGGIAAALGDGGPRDSRAARVALDDLCAGGSITWRSGSVAPSSWSNAGWGRLDPGRRSWTGRRRAAKTGCRTGVGAGRSESSRGRSGGDRMIGAQRDNAWYANGQRPPTAPVGDPITEADGRGGYLGLAGVGRVMY